MKAHVQVACVLPVASTVSAVKTWNIGQMNCWQKFGVCVSFQHPQKNMKRFVAFKGKCSIYLTELCVSDVFRFNLYLFI